MKREEMINNIRDKNYLWDIIVIGGGATGTGTAVEAASRGYTVLLLEQHDFAKGTSSRSTKLIHGGVRYLQQGNVSLVLEALKERGLLIKNAPHLVHNLPFIVPTYDWWEGPFYGVGLKLYDMLAGKHGFGSSKVLSKEETLQHIPTVETEGLRGGVIYYDGQFDDARLVINLAETADKLGASIINYIKVTGFLKKGGMINGVTAVDQETGEEFHLNARAVVNACGVFSDSLRITDDENSAPMIKPSQGIHIILDKSFLPGDSAIMVPHTDDGRILFAIPWEGRVLVGTTDTPVKKITLEPRPLKEELDFILSTAARYLEKDPSTEDIKSVFAGLRPLVGWGGGDNTAVISREHTVVISRSGLVTIAGGKWTTYRKMAEETVDHAALVAQLEYKPSVSAELPLHGCTEKITEDDEFKIYGSDSVLLRKLINESPNYALPLIPGSKTKQGEVVWAVRNEMARNAEDFLARRTRNLLLDARASIEAAPVVVSIMAGEMKKSKEWEKEQVEKYTELAKGYLPPK
jgi:glycerol-3-phosphate dehydrogenase